MKNSLLLLGRWHWPSIQGKTQVGHWRRALTTLHFHSVAHDDHIYQLSWRPTNDVSQLQLASCSEDGTAKLLIVRVATNVKHHP